MCLWVTGCRQNNERNKKPSSELHLAFRLTTAVTIHPSLTLAPTPFLPLRFVNNFLRRRNLIQEQNSEVLRMSMRVGQILGTQINASPRIIQLKGFNDTLSDITSQPELDLV